MKKLSVLLGILLISVMSLFADGSGTKIISSGTTTEYGDYVVTNTENVYHYQGKEYEVYKVMYDDPTFNMNIGVNGKEYIAYNEDFIFFYECTKKGFGVRKVLFSNPTTRSEYDAKKFSNQTILCADKKINTEKAIGIIAVFVPKLKS